MNKKNYSNNDVVRILLSKIKILEERTMRMEKMLEERNFYPFDPTPYMKRPKSDMLMLFKYKGKYYKKVSELVRLVNEDRAKENLKLISYDTVIKAIKKDDQYMVQYEVNTVFAKLIGTKKHYITTDGILLNLQYRPLERSGKNKSYYALMIDGVRDTLYPDVWVWHMFVEDYDPETSFMRYDADLSNSRIDNLTIAIKEEGDE